MTDFFDKLSKTMADGMTVNITVAKKGEKLNVLFIPIPKDKKKEDITPFTISGTGMEVDTAYQDTMLVGTAHMAGMKSNAAEFLKASGADKPVEKTADMFKQPELKKKDAPQPVPVTNPAVVAAPPAAVIGGVKTDEPNTQFENQQPAPVTVGEPVVQPVAPVTPPVQTPNPSSAW